MRTWLGGTGPAVAAFGLVAALVLGGLWWMTEAALRLEAEQGEVRAAVDLNSRLRIALWRLDGRLSPVLAQESARPFEHYSAVFVPAAALDAHGAAWPSGAILEPSPLLDAPLPAWMRLHFQFAPDGVVSSPEAPPEALLTRLREAEVSVGNVTADKQAALVELQRVLDPARLAMMLPPLKAAGPSRDVAVPPPAQVASHPRSQAGGSQVEDLVGPPTEQAAMQQQTDGDVPARNSIRTVDPSPRQLDATETLPQKTEPNASPNLPEAGGYPSPPAVGRAVPTTNAPGAGQQSPNQPGQQPGLPTGGPGAGGGMLGGAVGLEPSGGGMGGGGLGGFAGGGGGPISGGLGRNDLGPGQPVAPGQQLEDYQSLNQAYPQMTAPPAGAYETKGDYAQRMAQRGAVAKDVVNNTMKPGRSYNAYANDVNLDWLTVNEGTLLYATVPDSPVEVGPLTPVWLPSKNGGEPNLLVAARLVRLGERTICQGVLIDWLALRAELIRELHDLFPAADLKAGAPATADALERTLTTLPVQLDPSETLSVASPGWSPLRIGVAIAWTAALAALLSAGLGGWSLWELSQRRIRFVSAVTHELRTPLTTLRLYLDMLTSGLVDDAAQQQEYLATLNAESDRLNRLITNVLEFSRLEGRRSDVLPQDVQIDALLADVETDWERRCRDAGKQIVIENALAGRTLVTDERLAVQILGILVDNACKYSRGADDCRLWLRADSDGRGGVIFEVEDRGPGVPTTERQRVFQPFWRGRRDDAAAGGVGLGLTLAQRWTALLRGRLTVEPAHEATGACFRLQVPGLKDASGPHQTPAVEGP